jgi:adenylate cyclase
MKPADDFDLERSPDSETWRGLLTGTDPTLKRIVSLWRHVPSSPRCKVCAAPFHGVGGVVSRVVQHKRKLPGNPLLCNLCFGSMSDRPGGAEIDVSVLFADLRGSTGLAERIGPVQFRRLLQSFYEKATSAVERNDGIVDKLLGDGVMALFIPVIAGENHRLRAIQAGRQVVLAVEGSGLRVAGARVGVGVQSGTAFVGDLGTGDRLDFSALGDVVNTAARLGGLAGPAELMVSAEMWRAAGLETAGRDLRQLDIAGRQAQLETLVLGAADLADDAAFNPSAGAAKRVA